MSDFTLSVTVSAGYDAALDRVRALLDDAGFGVLTEIDLASTLHAKLGVQMAPRVILGACRPSLAHQAIGIDPRVATMLPCNVVVADAGEGRTRVDVFDPAVMTAFNAGLAEVAADARTRLSAMMVALTDDVEDTDATRA